MNDAKAISYLKSRYLSPTIKEDTGGEDSEVIGRETSFSGAETENKFLLGKITSIEKEFTKWLSVLKSKIKN